MRERLTGAFVALTVALLLAVLLARSYTTESRLRAGASDSIQERAAVIAALVEVHLDQGLPMTEAVLADLVQPDQRIEFEQLGSPAISIEGDDFSEGNDGQDFVGVVEIPDADASVTLLQSDEVLDDLVGDERFSIALVLLLAAIVAAVVGYLMSRLLAAPFLKRGRRGPPPDHRHLRRRATDRRGRRPCRRQGARRGHGARWSSRGRPSR